MARNGCCRERAYCKQGSPTAVAIGAWPLRPWGASAPSAGFPEGGDAARAGEVGVFQRGGGAVDRRCGFDPATGEVGVAVQSRVFSVDNGVMWGEAGVGVVATQAIVDVSYGPQALALLREGLSPEDVVREVLARDPDPDPERWTKEGRQFSVMNAQGEVATHTGPRASEWAGHRIGEHCSAQGNILAGPEVVDDMATAFESTEGQLSLRLQAALEAGQAAGGDTRGMQSAAMLIVGEDRGVWLNNDVVLRLQVDDHAEPIAELRRLVEKAAAQRERRGRR